MGASRVIHPDDPAYAGQKIYTPRILKTYDAVVLGFSSMFVWRCPAARLLDNYNRHVRRRHLDIGPGSGYFLDRATLPAGAEVTLADPNPHVLSHAARRVAHLDPAVIEVDVCKPLAVDRRFESVALNYVLHCLPGPMASKGIAIGNAAAVLERDGVLFGATVLGENRLHTWLSRPFLRAYNERRIFDNMADTEHDLRDVLSQRFDTVDVEVIGSVAVYSAAYPRGR